ncbi:MAG: DUF1232 domain-containing protein [Deltaproteobacteria bacterium]|nr:DUF1232 domain-containing protein [Deltaproteobacteria bacterium]
MRYNAVDRIYALQGIFYDAIKVDKVRNVVFSACYSFEGEAVVAVEKHGFAKKYSDKRFGHKVVAYARIAGREVIEKALWLYYAAQNPATPAWAKKVIYGALGYFIFPLDAIADIAPLVGYVDDLGVLAIAVITVALFITADVKARAARQLKEWFGE